MTGPAAAGAAPTPNDAAAAAEAAAAATRTAAVTTGDSDHGFPADTPLEHMTEAQRTAYWRHYARKHEDAVKAFKGMTPQQVADLQVQVAAMEAEKLTADEKAVLAAKQEAADSASAAAKAELLPQIQALEVKALAGTILSKEQLEAFMAVADPAKFVGEDGHADEKKVMGHLTAMFGQPSRGPQSPRWQNAGQYAPAAPPRRPGEAGRAEAARRFGGTKS